MINASSTKMVPPITPPATGPASDASAAPIHHEGFYAIKTFMFIHVAHKNNENNTVVYTVLLC